MSQQARQENLSKPPLRSDVIDESISFQCSNTESSGASLQTSSWSCNRNSRRARTKKRPQKRKRRAAEGGCVLSVGARRLFNSPAPGWAARVQGRDSQLPLETLRSGGTPGAVWSQNKQHGDLGCLSSCQPAPPTPRPPSHLQAAPP